MHCYRAERQGRALNQRNGQTDKRKQWVGNFFATSNGKHNIWSSEFGPFDKCGKTNDVINGATECLQSSLDINCSLMSTTEQICIYVI